LFVATLKRGAILLGACDGARLVGFVYSFPGLKDGRRCSGRTCSASGPNSGHRASAGLEARAAADQPRHGNRPHGMDIRSLVAVNAHLNVRRLGAVADDYVVNVYGDSISPLHKGAPTDRFIAQWWMRSPRVEHAISGAAAPARQTPEARRLPSTRSSARATGSPAPDSSSGGANRGWASRSRPASPRCSCGSRMRRRHGGWPRARSSWLTVARLPGDRLLVRAGCDRGTYLLEPAPRRLTATPGGGTQRLPEPAVPSAAPCISEQAGRRPARGAGRSQTGDCIHGYDDHLSRPARALTPRSVPSPSPRTSRRRAAARTPSAPFTLFLARLDLRGHLRARLLQAARLPTEGIRIVQRMERDPRTGLVGKIGLDIEVPADFPGQVPRRADPRGGHAR